MANKSNQTKNTTEINGGILDSEEVSALICSVWQGFIDELENELENVDFLDHELRTLLAL